MESLQPTEVILEQLQAAGVEHLQGRYGARERLLSLSRTLTASLEYPIESLQRMWWAEVSRILASLPDKSGQTSC